MNFSQLSSSLSWSVFSLFAVYLLLPNHMVYPEKTVETSGNRFTDDQLQSFRAKAICFQHRFRTDQKKLEAKSVCHDMIDNFCDYIQCEPVNAGDLKAPNKCPSEKTFVENVVGHGCCPACVRFLEDGAQCTPGHVLEQCANGLICSPSKRTCDVPREQRACLIEYHNRKLLRKKIHQKPASGFWIPGDGHSKTLMFEYADNMEMPACSPRTGDYEIKQMHKNKAFCVNPSNGLATFGLAGLGEAANVSCRCSAAMFDKLNRLPQIPVNDYEAKERALEKLDKQATDHFADTHVKCTPTGDFHEMQCVNDTCLCVDTRTGVPLTTVDDWNDYKDRIDALIAANKDEDEDDEDGDGETDSSNGENNNQDGSSENDDSKLSNEERLKRAEERKIKEEEKRKRESRIPTKEVNSSATVIFGAFRPLLCFDEKRAKIVNSNYSKDVYIEDCQSQILTSMKMQKHFAAKGTKVEGIETKSCIYDDRFSRRQCKSDSCRCSDPSGSSIGSYGVELSKADSMDCRCAIEEYFALTEKLNFESMHCDGMGNFSPLQCPNGRTCHCADSSGARISKKFSFECVNRFLKKYAPGYNLELICGAMRATLSNEEMWPNDVEMYYDNVFKTFRKSYTAPSPNHIDTPC